MKIGNVELENILILGPMAGITDMSFRALCREQGASLCVSEMISAKGLYYKNKNSAPLLETGENDSPLALQLFGSEPDLMAQEAQKLEEGPYDIFDINMGCPMPKIVNNGEGSALMKDPRLAGQIIEAMAKALRKPVTVKIRKGFDDGRINAVEIAHIAQESGAAAITVHGRTREEYYSGRADWDIIRQVKEAVNIPVIASGDITDGPGAERALKETGCDALMIARAARGNPWVFRQILCYLKDGSVPPQPAMEEVKATIIRQLDMMCLQAGEWSAVRQMRKHAAYYSAGYPNSTAFRRQVNSAETRQQFIETLTLWEE